VTRARVVLISPGDNRAPTGDSERDRVVGPGYVGLAGRVPGINGDERGGRVFGPDCVGLVGRNRHRRGKLAALPVPRARLERILANVRPSTHRNGG
jgi:hypothetical protein